MHSIGYYVGTLACTYAIKSYFAPAKPVEKIKQADQKFIGEIPESVRRIITSVSPAVAERIEHFKAKLKPGLILIGPPGCGKTLLAKHLADEIGCGCIIKNGSNFVSSVINEGMRKTEEIYRKAHQEAAKEPSKTVVLFVDEIDIIASQRTKSNPDRLDEASTRTMNNELSALLACMEGINSNKTQEKTRVILVGGTNIGKNLDEAFVSRLESSA